MSQFAQFGIVGSHFRPPAKGLLTVLPSGAKLVARREPDNAYDANAIMVLVARAELSKLDARVLNDAVLGYGSSLGDLMLQEEWHLGYIPRIEALTLAPRMDSEGKSELPGTLTFSATGLARIQLEQLP